LFPVKYIPTQKREKNSAAQGLITLATYGVGMLVGFAVAGWITDNYKMLEYYQLANGLDYSCRYIPRIFYYLHLFDSKKKRNSSYLIRYYEFNLKQKVRFKSIIAGTVTMGIPICIFLILH
jgi:hypothetical protein